MTIYRELSQLQEANGESNYRGLIKKVCSGVFKVRTNERLELLEVVLRLIDWFCVDDETIKLIVLT